MKSNTRTGFAFLIGIGLAIPSVSFAGAVISEIMYDLPDADAGREWFEVQNTGTDSISFLHFRLFDPDASVNGHVISSWSGNATTSPGGYAIIASNPSKFLIDWPSFTGTLLKSSFTFPNTNETFDIRLDGVIVDSVSYTSSTGASGDGNSLQRVSTLFEARSPTPGSPTATKSLDQASSTPSSDVSTTTAEDTQTSSASPTPAPVSGGAVTYTPKPQIYVSATVSTRGVAGAPLLFDATAVGIKKEPLPNAHYVWSFGDGGTVEGKKIFHTYHYPAVYTVLVDASSGEWSATDRKEVIIAMPELIISGLRAGSDGFIEVQNDGKNEIDLSFWILKSGQNTFTIPKGTIVGARKTIPFPAVITGLSADSANTSLLYPNGDLVVSYTDDVVSSAVSVATKREEPVVLALAPKTPEPERITPKPVLVQKEESKKRSTLVASGTLSTQAGQAGELIGAVGALEGGSRKPWFLGATLFVVVSVGGYMMMLRPRREPTSAEMLRKEAETFDIVE